MLRKASWMAVVIVALLATGVSYGAHQRIATSAYSFQRYFQDLNGARSSISPIERFVFSLVLASADPYPAEEQ